MADNDEPVSRRAPRRTDKVGQLVARSILDEMTRGGLEPGTRLPAEAQMMVDYQVGRGTLREALRILEVNGLITIKPGPGGGPTVEAASTHDFGRMATMFFHARGLTLRELIEARLVMEPVAARLAAQRRSEDDIAKLQKLIDFEEKGDEDAYVASTSDFHELIAEIGGNGVIAIFTESLAEVFHARVRGILFPPGKPRRQVVSTHAAIAQAVIDGDAETAEKLMLEHMEAYVRYVEKSHPTLMAELIDWIH
jgi:GntR family transcriptional regulator, transcriptional repressor for pyruvate dehydrogenase complex